METFKHDKDKQKGRKEEGKEEASTDQNKQKKGGLTVCVIKMDYVHFQKERGKDLQRFSSSASVFCLLEGGSASVVLSSRGRLVAAFPTDPKLCAAAGAGAGGAEEEDAEDDPDRRPTTPKSWATRLGLEGLAKLSVYSGSDSLTLGGTWASGTAAEDEEDEEDEESEGVSTGSEGSGMFWLARAMTSSSF